MSTFAVVVDESLESSTRRVDPSQIADQIRDIVNQLGVVFSHPLGLPLKAMEVSLTITAEGSVGFLGTGSKVGGEGSITLTFEQAEEKPAKK
jgi:hypothetical protein